MIVRIAFVLLFLTGCGGPSFTAIESSKDGGNIVRDTGTVAQDGGEVVAQDGDAPEAQDGGAPEATAVDSGTVLVDSGTVLEEVGDATSADGCTPVTHSSGVGQTWTDCVPLGTYNEAQAMEACAATGATPCHVSECGDPMTSLVCSNTSQNCWGYAGPFAGYEFATSASSCLTGSDPMWD